MRKILDIFEQDEDDVELTDYQKILALNKRKMSPYDVEFYDSEGKDYSDVIEVTQDGLIFTFRIINICSYKLIFSFLT